MQYIMSADMKRFNHLIAEINGTYHEASLRMGLSDSGMMILYTVCVEGGSCLLSDVVHLSGLTKQTVNSALRKLEKENVLTLEAAGGKRKTLRLTEKGVALANQTVVPVIEMEDAIFASWSEEDRQAYLSLTQKYLADLQARVPELKGRDEP